MPKKVWFRHKQVSPKCWRVLEVDDPYQEYCHCYVRLGADKCVLIDTGCGSHDLRGYIDQHINTEKLPYFVICTHSHFDHVGSNYQFPEGICFGGADAAFTQSVQGLLKPFKNGGAGDPVKPFTISRWLQEGDLIPLGPAPEDGCLEILHTPGHSPDSISLWDAQEQRIFSGDFLYPAAGWDNLLAPPGGLYAAQPGCDLYAYLEAMHKFRKFIALKTEDGLPAITLACGHNSYSEDVQFVTSAIELLEGVRDGTLEPAEVPLWGQKMWEYTHPTDRRAAVVVPLGLKGRLYKFGETI